MRIIRNLLRSRADGHSVVFEVGGMTCGSCVARIEGILSDQPGVGSAAVDLASGRARVTLSSDASIDGIVTAVEQAGYTMAASPRDP